MNFDVKHLMSSGAMGDRVACVRHSRVAVPLVPVYSPVLDLVFDMALKMST